MAGDGGRWREMAGDGGRRRRAAAAVGRGVRGQACAWAGAAEGGRGGQRGAAAVAAAWWVKLLQSRYARASSYACTCARGCEVVSGGECRVS